MGRKPVNNGLKRGPWSADEDLLLIKYVETHGEGHWSSLPSKAGLLRCGKSCRLRWMNYLRPTVKRGNISKDEEDLIFRLHNLLGNRWSLIAARIPGRTDSEVKNFWNTYMSKKIGGGTGLAYINNSMNIHKPIIRPEAYKPPVDCFTDLLQRDQHQEVNRICLDRNESMDKKPNANPDTAKDLECTASSKSSSDVEPQHESSLQAQYTTVMENSHNKSINSSHETTIDDFIDYICNNFDKDASPSLCQTYSSDTLISDTAGIIAAEHELGEIASNNYNFCAAPYDQATMSYVEPSVFTDTNFPATELVTLEDAPLSSLSWVQFEMHSVDGIQPTFIHSGINLEDGSQELNMVNFHKLDQPFNTDPEQGNSSMSLFSYLNSLGSF